MLIIKSKQNTTNVRNDKIVYNNFFFCKICVNFLFCILESISEILIISLVLLIKIKKKIQQQKTKTETKRERKHLKLGLREKQSEITTKMDHLIFNSKVREFKLQHAVFKLQLIASSLSARTPINNNNR